MTDYTGKRGPVGRSDLLTFILLICLVPWLREIVVRLLYFISVLKWRWSGAGGPPTSGTGYTAWKSPGECAQPEGMLDLILGDGASANILGSTPHQSNAPWTE